MAKTSRQEQTPHLNQQNYNSKKPLSKAAHKAGQVNSNITNTTYRKGCKYLDPFSTAPLW